MADDPSNESVGEGLSVVQAIRQYRQQAEEGRSTRMELNRRNREMLMGVQDWSGKIEGQSREFLPKIAQATEQFGAFVKRSLTQLGDWFSVDVPRESPLSGAEVRSLMRCFLDNLVDGSRFSTKLSDAVKMGSLESLIILKVHGFHRPERRFFAERSDEGELRELGEVERDTWRLGIDVVRTEDYYPDPSGSGLYEIHRVERDLHEVMELAKGDDPIYDPDVVAELVTSQFKEEHEDRREHERGQNPERPPGFRKRVVLDEFWGTILDEKGRVVHRNVVATVANDQFLIRKPEANPWWHQESPIVAVPIFRVPHSVWHRALYDDASGLNQALNELFNLMLDGGLASVWGIRQVRPDVVEEPSQLTGGIGQGTTIVMKEGVPAGVNAVEQVGSGRVPQDAMQLFSFADREFMAASMTNEIRLGQLPGKQVRATEIVEASQSQGVTLDAIASDLENEVVEKVLRKAWLNVLQNVDDVAAEDVFGAVGEESALRFGAMSPAERFEVFEGCRFRVHGLSATLNRARDFQKLMALIQAAGTNPMLMQAFMQRFSMDRVLEQMVKQLNLNPENYERDEREAAMAGQQQQEVERLMGVMGGQNARSLGEGLNESGMQSEVNQEARPTAGV